MTVKLKRMPSDDRPLVVLAALEEEATALESSERLQVIVCGVGKVAAAMAAQRACDVLAPRALISIGLAGGVDSESERGRLIIASGAAQHDYDARPIAAQRGEMPGLGRSVFIADESLCRRLLLAAQSVVEDRTLVRTGLVLTGDQIIATRAARDGILGDFPDGACFDMETAAVAQVAHVNGLPWGGVRITSDSADESFDMNEVLRFGAHTASELFARIVIELTAGF
jgi:adenosylhomocysteine nucleosidase